MLAALREQQRQTVRQPNPPLLPLFRPIVIISIIDRGRCVVTKRSNRLQLLHHSCNDIRAIIAFRRPPLQQLVEHCVVRGVPRIDICQDMQA